MLTIKTNPGMQPIKKWLDITEAMQYTNTGRDVFMKDIAPRISVALLGKKKVYKHLDIDKLIENNILINQ